MIGPAGQSTERITCTYISGELSASFDLACDMAPLCAESVREGVRKKTGMVMCVFGEKKIVAGRWSRTFYQTDHSVRSAPAGFCIATREAFKPTISAVRELFPTD